MSAAALTAVPNRLLLGSGPSIVPESVLAALSQPTIGHMDPAFAAIMNETIMPGPAFWAAVAVRTKIPVPMTAPIPSMVSWTGPSERCSVAWRS